MHFNNITDEISVLHDMMKNTTVSRNEIEEMRKNLLVVFIM